MKLAVTSLDSEVAGEVNVPDAIFAVPLRTDLIQRTILWQLARRRSGTHKVKGRGEIKGSNRKEFRQKGTGRARRGNGKVSQFRGGGRAFGPVVRSHEYKLPKKVRKLALCSAISEKYRQGELLVVKEEQLKSPKTGLIYKNLAKLDSLNALIVMGKDVDKNFNLAVRNLPNIVIMPSEGANVYDIIRHKKLILSEQAVACLQKRLEA